MRESILQQAPLPRLLTTDDAAKYLGLSRRQVRNLAHGGELGFEPTRSGQLIFHIGEVRRCELQRADARTRNRQEVLVRLRLAMVKAGTEPRQLTLFSGPRLQLVRGERAFPDREVNPARSFEQATESEKPRYVDRKVAGGRR